MNIYLVNIPIVILGASIVLAPLVHKLKHREDVTRQPTSPTATSARHDEHADDLEYAG